MSGEYNGWTNYETWCIYTWLSNEEETDRTARAAAAKADDADEARVTLREWIRAINPLGEDDSMWSDLLTCAIDNANWSEIARHFMPEE